MYRRGRARALDEAVSFSGKTRHRPPGLTSVTAERIDNDVVDHVRTNKDVVFRLPGFSAVPSKMDEVVREGTCAPPMARLRPEPSF